MYRLIGAASGWGAQVRACEQGPEILRSENFLEDLRKENIKINAWKILYPEKRAEKEDIPLARCLPLIHAFNLSLAQEVEKTLEGGDFPIVLGGDHSIAVGTWNGVYQYCKKKRQLPLGLIWIDAHMDANTPQTTPSGAWHGMPIAGLLGYGDPKMAALLQKESVLHPEHICLIGIRSFEEGEAQLLKRLNVRIFFMDEVNQKGMEKVMAEALSHVKKRTQRFGVSLDLDAISPKEAPGVGSPEEGGIMIHDLLNGLKLLEKEDQFLTFELVEYNPQKNHRHQTAEVCRKILSTIMRKRHG